MLRTGMLHLDSAIIFDIEVARQFQHDVRLWGNGSSIPEIEEMIFQCIFSTKQSTIKMLASQLPNTYWGSVDCGFIIFQQQILYY